MEAIDPIIPSIFIFLTKLKMVKQQVYLNYEKWILFFVTESNIFFV